MKPVAFHSANRAETLGRNLLCDYNLCDYYLYGLGNLKLKQMMKGTHLSSSAVHCQGVSVTVREMQNTVDHDDRGTQVDERDHSGCVTSRLSDAFCPNKERLSNYTSLIRQTHSASVTKAVLIFEHN